jgi:hypothetical protein
MRRTRPMELNEKQVKLAIGALIVVVIGLGYLVWTRSAAPEPSPLPNQSLLAPMGASKGATGQAPPPDLGMMPPAARQRYGAPPSTAMPGSR